MVQIHAGEQAKGWMLWKLASLQNLPIVFDSLRPCKIPLDKYYIILYNAKQDDKNSSFKNGG